MRQYTEEKRKIERWLERTDEEEYKKLFGQEKEVENSFYEPGNTWTEETIKIAESHIAKLENEGTWLKVTKKFFSWKTNFSDSNVFFLYNKKKRNV